MGSLRRSSALSARALPNARIEDLLAATDDCVFVLDEAWRFVLVNARADDELGAGSLLGSVIWDSFPESVGSDFELCYRRAAKSGTPQTFEAFYKPLESWYEARAVPISGRLVVFFRNITERRRAVERALRDRVHAQVRINELQAELIHATRVTMIGTMTSALAHEINQPLTAATNYMTAARLMLQAVADPSARPAREAVVNAAAETMRAGEIIRRLRRLVERREADMKPVELGPLVGEALALALPKAKLAEISVAIRVPPQLQVQADPVQVQQVLINLVRNAAEAMEGGATRELTVAADASGDELVLIKVADTGAGIAPDQRENLFAPFSTTKDDGLGVGLSICRAIVEAHGGRIWLEESQRPGTTFCLTLRRAPFRPPA